MSTEKDRSNMSTARICHDQPERPKLTKHEAARKLAQLVEKNMDRKGLSEDKKNARVQSAIEYVDAVIVARATRAK
jgi:hypothetical protein